MKNKTSKTNESQVLALLKKILPKATADARLAEKIFDAVDNCAWVSIPMTVSHSMAYCTPTGCRRCQSVAS